MKLRKSVAALILTAVVPIAAACGATTDDAASTSSTSSTTSSETSTDTGFAPGGPGGGGGPGAVDVDAVTTEAELIALIQDAYGDGSLDLHRGHQPVQDVLDDVLAISHEELHVRMEEQEQNLAAVAEDIGVDPQTLVDALVESWSPAIDNLLAAGTITEEEAEQYEEALEEAFTFRVNWDGVEEMPTFSGLDA
jgi:polyhydroxyalkanoate synthesis regulator phasin